MTALFSHEPDGSSFVPQFTLSYSMGPELDAGTVGDLRARHGEAGIAATQVKINCAGVQRIDPVGALMLHRFVLELERLFGSSVSLNHLPVTLVNQLRNHPLYRYLGGGEELFEDPFASAVPSSR